MSRLIVGALCSDGSFFAFFGFFCLFICFFIWLLVNASVGASVCVFVRAAAETTDASRMLVRGTTPPTTPPPRRAPSDSLDNRNNVVEFIVSVLRGLRVLRRHRSRAPAGFWQSSWVSWSFDVP